MKLQMTIKDHFQETLSKVLIKNGKIRFGDAWVMVYDYEPLYSDILSEVVDRGEYTEADIKNALNILVRDYRPTRR